jgi:hypothetical protein
MIREFSHEQREELEASSHDSFSIQYGESFHSIFQTRRLVSGFPSNWNRQDHLTTSIVSQMAERGNLRRRARQGVRPMVARRAAKRAAKRKTGAGPGHRRRHDFEGETFRARP